MRHVFLLSMVLVGCGRTASPPDDAGVCPACPVCPSATVAASASTKLAPEGEETATKTCAVRVVQPPGSVLKLGAKVVELRSGKLELTGHPGQQFFVLIEMPKKPTFVQHVYITDDGCAPADIDPERVPSLVEPPKK